MSIDVSDNNNQQTDILDINPELPMSVQTEVNETFEKEYVLQERPENPAVNAELKLTLNEHRLFSVIPKCLSYLEKDV